MGMVIRPDQVVGDRPARISERAARQISAQAGRVYRDIAISGDSRGKGSGSLGGLIFPGLIPATVTQAITPCSTSSTPVPGFGYAQLSYWNDDTGVMVQNPDDGPAGNGIVLVKNWYRTSGTIAVAKQIFVASFSNVYWLIASEC